MSAETIGEAGKRCAQAFVKVTQLVEDPSQTRRVGIDAAIRDQLSRFKIWAGNLGLFADGNLSADFRLRNHDDVRDVILKMLDRLEKKLESVDSDTPVPSADLPVEDLSDTSSSNTSTDVSENSSEPELEKPQPASSIKRIEEIITNLYRITAVIKKPVSSREDDLVKAWSSTHAQDIQPELADLQSYLEWWTTRQFSTLSMGLRRRIMDTSVQRRKRLLYRKKHRIALESDIHRWFEPRNPASVMNPTPQIRVTAPHAQARNLDLPVNESEERLAAVPEDQASSVPTRGFSQRAKSVILSDITPSVKQGLDYLDVPPIPKPVAGSVEVVCPYCNLPLKKDIQKDTSGLQWRRHVLQDIDPYICLFEDCEASTRSYKTKDEWISHMVKQHTAIWSCQTRSHADQLFMHEEDLANHFREEHRDDIPEEHIPFMLERSKKPMPDPFAVLASKLESYSCPFTGPLCSEEVDAFTPTESWHIPEFPEASYKRIRDHLAGHLETVALFSLPLRDSTSSRGSSERVIDDAQQREDASLEDLPDLVFEDPPVSPAAEDQPSIHDDETHPIIEEPEHLVSDALYFLSDSYAERDTDSDAAIILRERALLNLAVDSSHTADALSSLRNRITQYEPQQNLFLLLHGVMIVGCLLTSLCELHIRKDTDIHYTTSADRIHPLSEEQMERHLIRFTTVLARTKQRFRETAKRIQESRQRNENAMLSTIIAQVELLLVHGSRRPAHYAIWHRIGEYTRQVLLVFQAVLTRIHDGIEHSSLPESPGRLCDQMRQCEINLTKLCNALNHNHPLDSPEPLQDLAAVFDQHYGRNLVHKNIEDSLNTFVEPTSTLFLDWSFMYESGGGRDTIFVAPGDDKILQHFNTLQSKRRGLDKLGLIPDVSYDKIYRELTPLHLDGQDKMIADIRQWIDDPDGKPAAILYGSPGSGKTIICAIVAYLLNECRQLGASFFFDDSYKIFSNSSCVFLPLAAQLSSNLPFYTEALTEALAECESVSSMSAEEQFVKLISQPLATCVSNFEDAGFARIVIIVDGLDECENGNEILGMLGKAGNLPDFVRVFFSTRPNIEPLHTPDSCEIFRLSVDSMDLDRYLYLAMGAHNLYLASSSRLSPITDLKLEFARLLLRSGAGAFAEAKTIVEITLPKQDDEISIEDWRPIFETMPRLRSPIVDFETSLYQAWLDHVLQSFDEQDRTMVIQYFQYIINTIAILVRPVSQFTLAEILDLDEVDVVDALTSFAFVFNDRSDWSKSVQIAHSSFYNFLLGSNLSSGRTLRLNPGETHYQLSKRLIQLLQQHTLSGLAGPVDYACRYWTYHVVSAFQFLSNSEVEELLPNFLSYRFLDWVKVMRTVEGDTTPQQQIDELTFGITQISGDDSRTCGMLRDCQAFLRRVYSMIQRFPDQLYSSGLIFTPRGSFIREAFKDRITGSFQLLTIVRPRLPETFIVSEDGCDIKCMCFSPDSMLIAAGSSENTVTLWDTTIGRVLGHQRGLDGEVDSIAFSPDGSFVLLALSDGNLWVWDGNLECKIWTMSNHDYRIYSIAYSPDGGMIASASTDGICRLWRSTDRAETGRIEMGKNISSHLDIAFTLDNELVVFRPLDKTVEYFNVDGSSSGTRELENLSDMNIAGVEFSRGARFMACRPNTRSLDNAISVWDLESGAGVGVLEGHGGPVAQMSLSADGRLLASIARTGGLRLSLWDVQSGTRKIKRESATQYWSAKSLTLSPNRRLLATLSADGKVEIQREPQEDPWVHVRPTDPPYASNINIAAVTFTGQGRLVAAITGGQSRSKSAALNELDMETFMGLLPEDELESTSGEKVLEIGGHTIWADDFNRGEPSTGDPSLDRIIGVKGEWVQVRGTDVLYLPEEYQGTRWAARRNLLAVASKDGSIAVLSLEDA